MSKIYLRANDVFQEYCETHTPFYQYTLFKDGGFGCGHVMYENIPFSLDEDSNIHLFSLKEALFNLEKNKPIHIIIPKERIKKITFSRHWRAYFRFVTLFSFPIAFLFGFGTIMSLQSAIPSVLVFGLVAFSVFALNAFLMSFVFYSRKIKISVWDGPTYSYVFPNCFHTNSHTKVQEAQEFENYIKRTFCTP